MKKIILIVSVIFSLGALPNVSLAEHIICFPNGKCVNIDDTGIFP